MSSQVAVPPKASPAAPSPLISFTPMIVVVGILYMLVIRPQQKQAREHRRMIDSLKSGDRVLTSGGIYGTVAGIRGAVVQLKIADNVRVEVNRTSIAQVILEPTNGSASLSSAGEKAS